ncbi:MAG: PilZ domain-containing protein [Acidobacteriia bacterium]|nr:PilZ domain-containing protein [Terriglobia bacterium]
MPAHGEVFIELLGPRPVFIIARLKDISTGGFRASHSSPFLESGQQVRFNHDGASGTARVAWNRSVEGKWESGFFLVG